MSESWTTTVRNVRELGEAFRKREEKSSKSSGIGSSKFWSQAPKDKDEDTDKDHGEGQQPSEPPPRDEPDDHIIERTLPKGPVKIPLGPTDI